MWTTRHGALIGPGATVVQVDDDPAALGAQRPVHLGVLGDVGATARDVLAAVDGRPGAAHGGGRQADRGRGPVERPAAAVRGDGERIDPRVLSAALDDLLPAARTLGVDSGNFMGYPAPTSPCPTRPGSASPRRSSRSGWGSPPRSGAALARPDRLPVAALGDGGFLMGVAELETAVRLGLGLLVVVYDDAGYGAEFHHFPHDDHGTVRFPDTDLAAIAAGFGCAAATVRAPADLAVVRDWLAGPARPPAPARRQGPRRRAVLVAGGGVQGALGEHECAG